MPRHDTMQWGWSNMEELLQCPVCLDVPATGVVEQCQHGHHICRHCKAKLDRCPLCKSCFFGTRNFVVEELVRNLQMLKNIMQLSKVLGNETQEPEKVEIVRVPKKGYLRTPPANKGMYPCRYNSCDVILPIARLLNHARSCHSTDLIEGAVDYTGTFSHTYEVSIKNGQAINRRTYITFVSGIGLVYLNFELLRTGELIVFPQLAMKFTQAQNFVATIEFSSGELSLSYCTRLISIKDDFTGMLNRRVCYILNRKLSKRLRTNGSFTCKLILSAYNSGFDNYFTSPDINLLKSIITTRENLLNTEQTPANVCNGEHSAQVSNLQTNSSNVVNGNASKTGRKKKKKSKHGNSSRR